jgi:hypothetical protein
MVEQVQQGRFSRLEIRDAVVVMNDTVYGLYRRFEKINATMEPTPDLTGTEGKFTAVLAGNTMRGTISRTMVDGKPQLDADITNIDFAAFLPFIDDESGMVALRGAGALSIDVNFDAPKGKLVDGRFKADLTGVDLRLADVYYPVASSIMDITWTPQDGRFELHEAAIQVGQSTAKIGGIFAMGLDPVFGPTIGMSFTAREVAIHPYDMAPPASPFDSVEFVGWSAPLYGAQGIDRLTARKGEGLVEMSGRLDMVTAGLGVDMRISGQGVSADDVKRLWPYIMATETRDWFVANVTEGVVSDANLRFHFPVGTLSLQGEEDKPLPPDSLQIDMAGVGVAVKPTEAMPPITLDGQTRLQVDDAIVTVSAGGGKLETAAGLIEVTTPAIVIDNSDVAQSVLEVSGNIGAPIPAALALLNEQQPGLLDAASLPVDVASLTGAADVGFVATLGLPNEKTGKELSVDYVVTGTVKNFASSKPIQERIVGNGQLSFTATQDAYKLSGTADIDGMSAELEIAGTPSTDPSFKFGFDVSEFLKGKIRFVAEPLDGGKIRIAVDIKEATLTLKDLGLSKAAGRDGTVSAVVAFKGDVTEISEVDLAFGTVRAKGEITYHNKEGFKAATLTGVALGEGDDAQIAVAPISGGYEVQIRGKQLDLKPVLSRFFGLDQGSGGVQTTQLNQAITLNVKLDRALGFYATTAFNLELDLVLRGGQMRRVNMQAQFKDGNAMSVTTNPAPNGRTLSVAFNDAGTILRLVGVYSQLAGGTGSLVMTTDSKENNETGQLILRGFAVVDEANVAQILGNHSDSRAAIARANRLDFEAAQVDFTRRGDRFEIHRGVLSGATVGGTLRGFIDTGRRQYDLAGTYVPLFGLNNVFQQIPILGPILGGREGEGLLGVTFAVKGPLNQPQFLINPLSALVPGAFREIFEFRSQGQPTQ